MLTLHATIKANLGSVADYFAGRPFSLSAAVPLLMDFVYDKQLLHNLDTERLQDLLVRQTQVSGDEVQTVEQYANRVEHALASFGTMCVSLDNKQSITYRTLYRFRVDERLSDHSSHAADAFIPFYRFSQHRSFTAAIGNTMCKNVRQLYAYISDILGPDFPACPCVIIFDMFVRDSFRLFSLVSTQHCNYVVVRCDHSEYEEDGDSDLDCRERIVSYVQLTNAFPKISQWFHNINNQYVKKFGSHTIERLSAYLEQQMQANDAARMPLPLPHTPRAVKKNVARGRCAGVCAASTRRTLRSKLRLEQVFRKGLGSRQLFGDVMNRLFRTGYVDCKHANVVRTYVQLRSSDESATQIIYCRNCGKRL